MICIFWLQIIRGLPNLCGNEDGQPWWKTLVLTRGTREIESDRDASLMVLTNVILMSCII